MNRQSSHLSSDSREQRKVKHFHFDTTANEMSQQQQQNSSLLQQKMKRQRKMQEEQQQQKRVQKRMKKNNDQLQMKEGRNFEVSRQKFIKQQSILKSSQIISTQKIHQSAISNWSDIYAKQKNQLQEHVLKFLKELLFHPNRRENKKIFNSEIFNHYIVNSSTPNKLKSFLMLYMILYQFQSIQWTLNKKIYTQTSSVAKIITIDSLQSKNQQHKNSANTQYAKFKQNQLKKYFIQYLEWLIWTNQSKFQSGNQQVNQVFWALALNNCQSKAYELMATKDPKHRQKDILLALYLLNAQDIIFRQSLFQQKNKTILQNKDIMFMRQQNLQCLPKCHWLLGVNISARYFYKKQQNFYKIIEQSLSIQEINEDETNQFKVEYELLNYYFVKKCFSTNQIQNSDLSDNIFRWIIIQADNKSIQMKQIRQLNRKICLNLIQKAKKSPIILKQQILLALQILQRQSHLEIKQKDDIWTQVLYKKEKLAFLLNQHFRKAISSLQKKHQTVLSGLFQRLTLQYNDNYKHILLSQRPQLKYNALEQLRHLINISLKYRTEQIAFQIYEIITNSTLICHWNKKDVLKKLLNMIDEFIQKLINFQHTNKQSLKTSQKQLCEQKKSSQKSEMVQQNQNLDKGQKICQQKKNKQIIELKCLAKFLKVNLKLQALNQNNLRAIVSLILNAQSHKTILPFQSKTLTFMKQDVLSILFSHGSKNEGLILQIKKEYQNKLNQNRKEIKENEKNSEKNGQISLLSQIQSISQCIPYFSEKIQILKGKQQLSQ